MPHIQQLPSHVADLIAAGEVVERPASAVKELLENAIDAGAGAVTVEIRSGGMSLIRVTDDGCGIAADEAETAFLRHATSKIRTEYDLEAIGTLGFRGEALAAIAAVSRVDLLTRTPDAPLGVALSLEGGTVTEREESGCPAGTTIVIRDLFFNTPARLKFIKRDATEGAAVLAVVQREALAHPEVSFTFIREGKTELRTPGDGQLKSALYSVFGRDIALGFTPVKGSGEGGVTVSGFASLPVCCRGTRGYQHFFVNGRYIKSKTMTAALEQAYANQKMVGKFPGCVLHVTTKLSAVDVNVHPTKTEVKFASERQIFDAVYHAVLSALTGGSAPRPSMTMEKPKPVDTVTPNQTTLPLHDSARPVQKAAVQTPPQAAPVRPAAPIQKETPAPPPVTPTPVRAAAPAALKAEAPVPPSARPVPQPAPAGEKELPQSVPAVQAEPEVSVPNGAPGKTEGFVGERSRSAASELSPQGGSEGYGACGDDEPWRLAGEVLNTYIIVEQGEKILFIDKHAAHERMWFDQLKSRDWRPMSQILLAPIVFTPTPEEGAVLLENLPLLAEFGFEVEDFGGGALIVRQVPHDIDAEQTEEALVELAGRLLTTGGRADPAAARDALLHTMACKAAIKGGQKNGPAELERVARAVMSGQVRYCPHGRPVAIELTKAMLEKQFKRA
ncbi:MAG: DNA mismatch repair endonuclease MutL [Oscillospiraceae bacterium]